MTPEEFKSKFQNSHDKLHEFLTKKAPRLVGKMARDHFQDNFRQGGFVDSKLTKWTEPKRMNASGGAGSKYGPLLSARNELMNSITYKPGNGMVVISSDKVYAEIHNEGGVIDIPVTPKMKKFAWAKHYEENGKDKSANSMWKGIAITNKKSLKVTIPRRQFIGNSIKLENEITKMLEEEILKILNG